MLMLKNISRRQKLMNNFSGGKELKLWPFSGQLKMVKEDFSHVFGYFISEVIRLPFYVFISMIQRLCLGHVTRPLR